jgi:O-succinylhomoserine sulfhydrylase
LPLRVAQQQANAEKIADFLAGEEKIARVYYPGRKDHPQYQLAQRQMKGGSTMVAYDVAGGKAEAYRMANAFEIIKISNNLGDAKSLVTHPATTTHQRLTEDARAAAGIGPGMLRLSVGLEDVEDLIDDLRRGLAAV